MMTELDRILVGQTESHLVPFEGGLLVHAQVAGPLKLLKERAARDGIDLQIASAFRGFEAQLRIWNLKCTGKRDLLDTKGKKLDFAKLSDEEIVSAILRWSALPGGSRHHWGTDLDVFDKGALKEGMTPQLVPQEAAPGGPFEAFSEWLEENLSGMDFFRPYREDLGGVSPEWWHISFRPVAEQYLGAHSLPLLKTALQGAALEKRSVVEKRLPEIFKRYVLNISKD